MSEKNSIKPLRSIEEIRQVANSLAKRAGEYHASICDAWENGFNLETASEALRWAMGEEPSGFLEKLELADVENSGHEPKQCLRVLLERLEFLQSDLENLSDALPDSYYIHSAACCIALVEQSISKWFDDQGET